MSTILSLIQAITPQFPNQRDRDEAYLAGSVDTQDLERRMRELDQRECCDGNTLMLGLGLR